MIFSEKDCYFISSLWDESEVYDESYNKYAVHAGNKVKLKTNNVKANYVRITDSKYLNFIVDKLKPLGINSISTGEASLMKYSAGHFFGPHRDYPDYGYDRLNRTLVVQLTSPDQYEGGDLIIEGVVQSRLKGECISIKSNQMHEVTEIISGTRMTLVLFLLNRDIEHSISLI